MMSQDRPDHEPTKDQEKREQAPESANDPDPAAPETEPAEAAAAYARTQNASEPAPDRAPDQTADEEPDADQALAALQAENDDLRNQVLRAFADMENLRRRTAREKEDSAKYAISRFAKDLLPVADNLQRALQAIPQDAAADNDLMRTLAEGVAAVERELGGVLERHGVRPVEAEGRPFDSNVHEAVMEQPTADVPPGHVAQVFQAGYVLNDRLLRPAMVAVARALPDQAPEGEPQD